MALFAKRARETGTPRGQPEFEELGCPAFGQLIKTMDADPERKYQILDLSNASGNHIEYFSRFRCRFHIGDFTETATELVLPDEHEGEAPLDFEALLPTDNELPLDLVLCWNLLNYVHAEALPLLSEHLRSRCASGAWLHAFIYTRAEMPKTPGNFQILSSERMRYLPRSSEQTEAPRYPQRVLEGKLPGFRTSQSRLLKSGLQEILFRAV